MPKVIIPSKTTDVNPLDLKSLDKKIYTDDEIKDFRMDEAIQNHPLRRRPTNIRSKIAYQEILRNCKETNRYLLPGQVAIFSYSEPKFKEDLEYYDKTPFVLYFGLTRTKDDVIREIGLNLHYYPPHTRMNILNSAYEIFKDYFEQSFNEPIHKPNTYINWKALKHTLSRHNKIAFGVKMYVPVLRNRTLLVPTRLLPTAFHTEGHFSKATLQQIFHFWRQFR